MAKKKTEKNEIICTLSPEKPRAEFFGKYLGQPIAILCARYWYRGILQEIGADTIVLSNVRAVEQTGPSNNASPAQEDVVPSDMIISLDAMEQFCQPAWVWHEMDEAVKRVKKD